ncbi:MAG: hypothetical protein MJ150_06265, partial [Clostridia bacterium]|nr:hypothetical protein [Clostridia bacterium]
MAYKYFEWSDYKSIHPDTIFPSSTMEDLILVDAVNEIVWLPEHFSFWIYGKSADEHDPKIPFKDIHKYIKKDGYERLKEEYFRLQDGKEQSAAAHITIVVGDNILSTMVHLYKMAGTDDMLCFLSVDYEPIREFE